MRSGDGFNQMEYTDEDRNLMRMEAIFYRIDIQCRIKLLRGIFIFIHSQTSGCQTGATIGERSVPIFIDRKSCRLL